MLPGLCFLNLLPVLWCGSGDNPAKKLAAKLRSLVGVVTVRCCAGGTSVFTGGGGDVLGGAAMGFTVLELSSEEVVTGVALSRARPPTEGDLEMEFLSMAKPPRGEPGVELFSPLKVTGDALGDLFEGSVLLLLNPPLLFETIGPPTIDLLDVTETFLRRLPYFLTSSAPALEFDGDLLSTVFARRGDAGAAGATGTLRLSTASVSGFPRIPSKK